MVATESQTRATRAVEAGPRIPKEVRGLLHELAAAWVNVADCCALEAVPLKGVMTNKVYQVRWAQRCGRRRIKYPRRGSRNGEEMAGGTTRAREITGICAGEAAWRAGRGRHFLRVRNSGSGLRYFRGKNSLRAGCKPAPLQPRSLPHGHYRISKHRISRANPRLDPSASLYHAREAKDRREIEPLRSSTPPTGIGNRSRVASLLEGLIRRKLPTLPKASASPRLVEVLLPYP
jgi:hypothetical protein